jgi:uncharacterized protein YndB with AHSA1/START domain
MTSSTDRIERKILLKATPARVWRALSNPEELGSWFGVKFTTQAFTPGQPAKGKITHPGYEHLEFVVTIDRMEPERLLSWRWHPYAIETNVDYSKEQPTLVSFTLEKVEGGTLLTLTESGFDNVPAARRAEAFRMNNGGWDQQMKNIEKHVATP